MCSVSLISLPEQSRLGLSPVLLILQSTFRLLAGHGGNFRFWHVCLLLSSIAHDLQKKAAFDHLKKVLTEVEQLSIKHSCFSSCSV